MGHIERNAHNACQVVNWRLPHENDQGLLSTDLALYLNVYQYVCHYPDILLVIIGYAISIALLESIATVLTQTPTSINWRLAPGPQRYPIIGCLSLLRPDSIRWLLTTLPLKYGAVCRVTIGVCDVLVVSGWKTLRSALVGRQTAVCFAGRPKLHSFRLASEGLSMSFNSYSPEWRCHRRLAEKALTAAYTSSKFVENIASREALILVHELLAKSEKMNVTSADDSFNLDDVIGQSVGYTIYSLCYGDARRRCNVKMAGTNNQGVAKDNTTQLDDWEFEQMIIQTRCLIEAHNTGNAVDFFPWARRVLRRQLAKLDRICAAMLALTRQKLAEHAETYQPEEVRDVIDALIEVSQTKTGRRMDADRLALTVQEFIGAGLDILQAALQWIVLYMAEYPRVQDEVRKEVDALSGINGCCRQIHAENDGEINVENIHVESHGDRWTKIAVTNQVLAKLPYTESVILEVLRHSSVVPLALPHSTLFKSQLEGYDIPADTFVLTNLHSANHDPELWTDPEAFVPERFMQTCDNKSSRNTSVNPVDKSANIYDGTDGLVDNEHVINGCRRSTTTRLRSEMFPAFGLGKRRCIGEQLSRLVLATYLTTLVANCYVDRPPGATSIDLEPRYGIVLRPKACKVVFRRRQVPDCYDGNDGSGLAASNG